MARGAFAIGLAGLFACGEAFRVKSKSGVAALQKAADQAGVQFLKSGVQTKKYTLTFSPETSDVEIQRACNGHCEIMGHPSAGGIAFAVMSMEHLTELLEHAPKELESIQPDVQDHLFPDVPDEEPSVQRAASWGLDAVGVYDRPAIGTGVHVYVQDTGVRVTHQDFGGRAFSTLDFTRGPMVDCRVGGGCAIDGDGHGTHCAGTIGGKAYGVASGATLHAVKSLRDTGSGDRSWQIAAIEWVSLNGLKPSVISMSLGALDVDPNYNRVIAAATKNGVTIVAAAGNFADNTCKYVPVSVPETIAVSATDAGDSRAHYSNFGTCNDIMAPGSRIVSASHVFDFGTARKTGTSMAAPHVAGGAAIILSQFPWFKRDDIFAKMVEYGRKQFVQNLRPGDPDLALWVGKDPAPGKPACPDFATTTEPNYWGDCACKSGFCSLDGERPNCPTSAGVGGWGGNYFEWACKDCKCY